MASKQNNYIKKIRSEYPQYNDLDDVTLAKAYGKKHYADMEEDDFLDKVGLHQKTVVEKVTEVAKGIFDNSPSLSTAEAPLDFASTQEAHKAPVKKAAPASEPTVPVFDISKPLNEFSLNNNETIAPLPTMQNDDVTATRSFKPAARTAQEEFDNAAVRMLSPVQQDEATDAQNAKTFSTQIELSDVGNTLGKGAASIYKGAGWALEHAGDAVGSDGLTAYGTAVRDTGAEAAKYWDEGLTPEAVKARNTQLTVRDANGDISVLDTLTNIANNPATVGLMATESVPASALGMGVGGIIAKGFALVPSIGEKLASAIGYGLGEGIIAAPMQGVGTEEKVMAMKDADLLLHPEYRAMLDKLGDKDAAKLAVAKAAGGDAAMYTMVSTTLLSAPFGYVMAPLFAGAGKEASQLVRQGVMKESLTTGAEELGQEVMQSGAEQVASNYALRDHANVNQKLTEGVAESMVAGGVSGFGMGSVIGAGQTVMNNRALDTHEAKMEALQDAYTQDAYNKMMMGGGRVFQGNEAPVDIYAKEVDAHIKRVQDSLTNLAINHPEHTIPQEAYTTPAIAEQIIQEATDKGLNLSDNGGMNAIDTGFSKVAEEMGVDLAPVIEAQAPVASEAIAPVAQSVTAPVQEIDAADAARFKELDAKPEDELTIDERFELEDLTVKIGENVAQPNENNFAGESDLVSNYKVDYTDRNGKPYTIDVKVTKTDSGYSIDEYDNGQNVNSAEVSQTKTGVYNGRGVNTLVLNMDGSYVSPDTINRANHEKDTARMPYIGTQAEREQIVELEKQRYTGEMSGDAVDEAVHNIVFGVPNSNNFAGESGTPVQDWKPAEQNPIPFEERKQKFATYWDNANEQERRDLVSEYYTDQDAVDSFISKTSNEAETVLHPLTNLYTHDDGFLDSKIEAKNNVVKESVAGETTNSKLTIEYDRDSLVSDTSNILVKDIKKVYKNNPSELQRIDAAIKAGTYTKNAELLVKRIESMVEDKDVKLIDYIGNRHNVASRKIFKALTGFDAGKTERDGKAAVQAFLNGEAAPIPMLSEPESKGESIKIHVHYNDGVDAIIKGERIDLVDGFDFAVHKQRDAKGYNVSEARTGLVVASGKTKKEAIEAAKVNAEKYKDRIHDVINKAWKYEMLQNGIVKNTVTYTKDDLSIVNDFISSWHESMKKYSYDEYKTLENDETLGQRLEKLNALKLHIEAQLQNNSDTIVQDQEVSPMNKAQIKRAMKEYPDAGLNEDDSVKVAQDKINKAIAKLKEETKDANTDSGTKEPISEQLQGNAGTESKPLGTKEDGEGEKPSAVPTIESNGNVGSDATVSSTGVQPDRSTGDSDKRPSANARVETQNQYTLTQDDVYASGEVGRFVANVDAIKLLKENKQHYTKEEKLTLSKYTGFGGLGKAFRDLNGQAVEGWSERVRLLEGLLTADELKNVKSGQLDAYYTPIKIAQSMWEISTHLGFKGGTVLEPSMGVGRFVGLLPQTLKGKVAFNGIEIDPTTYKIAAALYGNINARNLGFEETNYDSAHDMVIGNPPYGEFKLYDKNKKEYNTLSAHNYFVVKSLDALKEGGVLNFVISSSFLDNLDAKTIKLINEKADFIGAIRLPSDAFKETGTKVTTDIILFQKKIGSNAVNPSAWSTKGTLNGFKINQYFIDNPKMLLGDWVKGYRGGDLKANGNFETQLAEAIASLPKDILNSDGAIQEIKKAHGYRPSVMYTEGESVFVNIKDGEGVTQKKINLAPAKAKQFIALRDELLKLVNMQLDTKLSDKEVEAQRTKVNALYDGWVKKNGALNKTLTRSAITKDKDGFLVATLEENYKGEIKADNKAGKEPREESWTKADILTTRTIRPQTDIKATNAKEALEFAINQKGSVDLEYMAHISGKSQETLSDELLGDIFYDGDAGWVTRSEFLSGDVKTKLQSVQDDFHKEALLAVIPKNLEAQNIRVEIGQSWIDAKYITQFMREELGYGSSKAHQSSATAKWFTGGTSHNFPFTASGVKNNEILDSALNNKIIRVTLTDRSGKTYLDEERTDFANSQVQMLKEKFEGWVFADAARRDELVAHYNEVKNRFVEQDVEDIIEKYSIPNLKHFAPRVHQTRAVYKTVFGANPMLLNHTVGSGKTLTSQMIAMEWRRLGKAKKPLIVTLKSVVPQYVREFKMAYPNAKILLPNDSDFSTANRKMLLSSIATGDYDAVVLSHEQLSALQNPLELQNELVLDEIDNLQAALKEVEDSELEYREKSRSKRQIELAIEKLETTLAKLQDANKDDVLGFDKLGVDGIIVDEAHYFKKLVYSTSMGSIKGMPDTSGSKRAFDLYVKTQYLLRSNPHKTVVFMTGTPITNTLPELYLLQKYLQADELKSQGINHFDAWAKDYTEQTTEIELTSTGGLKEVTRLKEFKNLDTLIQTTRQFVDTVTNNDIKKSDVNFKLPPLKNGKVTEVYAQPSEAQVKFNLDLIKRIAAFGKDNPDNHLAVFGDGAKMAIDMRLISNSFEDTAGSKVNLAVAKVFEKYQEFDSVKGTQLIFSDKGVPKGKDTKAKLEELIRQADEGNEDAQKALTEYSDDEIDDVLNGGGFSVYSDMKSKLVKMGIPENEIAFIHDFDTKEKKEKLGELVNSGEIRIVIGSTKKLGTGMNVQKRLTAVHHIDIPFTPAELEQRNGRIIRQGNELLKTIEGFEVEIVHYLTKRTLDAMNFQILQNKAKFIEQFYAGSMDGDVAIDEMSNSEMAEHIKAEASGNPLLIDKMRLEKQLQKLRRIARGQELANQQRVSKIAQEERFIKTMEAALPKLEADTKEVENNPVVINGKEVETRKEIGEAIYDEVTKIKESRAIHPKEIGLIGTVKIEAQYSLTTDSVKIVFKSQYPNDLDYTYTGQSIEGLGTKFVNKLDVYSNQFAHYTYQLPITKETLSSMKNSKEGTFDKMDELEALEKELVTVKKGIADAANPNHKVEEAKVEEEKTPTDSYMKITPNTHTKADSINQHYNRAQGYDDAGVNFVPTYSVIGLPSRSGDGFITIGDDRVALPSMDKPMNADTLRVYVSDIIGARLYDGKIKGNKNVGVYKHQDSSIRLKSFSDMETLSHEMAHYLDYFHKNEKKNAAGSFFRQAILKNKEEVKSLSYTTNPDEVISEGFAEFIRLYLTNYNTVAQLAPNMMKDFEARLNEDQVLAKKMVTLRNGLHQYFYQGATTRNYQGGELSTTAQKIQRSQAQIGKDYRQKLIDRIHSIKRIEAEIRGDNAVDAMNSPYKALQLVNGHSSIMHTAMNFGVPTIKANGDITHSGKSLNDIFAPATGVGEERVRLLSDYLVARRANELRQQGRENLIPQEAIDHDLNYVQEYPEFETIAKEYQAFNTAMLDFYVGMNHITEAQRESFLEFNQNYVPFHRVMDSVQNGKTVQMSAIGKRLTGGTHSLGNIMENIIDGLESNIKEALISRGKSMFYDMLDQSGMGGAYATKVPTQSQAFKADLLAQASAVARTMQSLGLSVSKDGMIYEGSLKQNDVFDAQEITQILMDRPELLTFFSHGHPPVAGSDSYIDSAIINGVRVYFETKDAGLIEAMTSFKGQHYNDAMNALMSVKNVITWNITNIPLFYLPNFARDTVSAGVLSKNGFVPVLTSIKGMYHFVAQSKVYKDFMASGAGYGTLRTTSGRDIQSMRMLNVNRGFDVFNKIISGLSYGADMFEYGTRVGEFELAQKAGKSNWQSAFEGREISTDFAIKGANSDFTGYMATVPFMKAAVNGIDKTARRIFSLNGEMKLSNMAKFHNAQGELIKHKTKLYATGGIIMAATLALWFQNKDDDRYKKLTRDQKLMYWNIFVGDKHIKIPRPYDIGFIFASLPEIIADGIYTKHGEEAVSDFIWGAKSMFLVFGISGLIKPMYDHMTNTNWMGSPIIPDNLQNVDDKGDQYNERTALIYKNVGKATGISPIMMQHYVDGYLGLTAKMIEETTENLLWDTKQWGARPFAQNPLEFLTYRFSGKKEDSRTAWSEKYYELSNKADGVKKSYDMKYKKAYIDGGKEVTKYASEKEIQAYLAIDEITGDINSELSDMKVQLEQVTYSNKLTKDQKEKIINDAYKAKRQGLEKVVKSLEENIKTLEGEK